MNLATSVRDRLTSLADGACIVALGADGTIADTWSRERLLDEASTWTIRFTEAGLAPDDRIAVCPGRGPELAALHLGALAAGLAIVPISTASTPDETSRLLAAAEPALIVTSTAFAHASERASAQARCRWWLSDVDPQPANGLDRTTPAPPPSTKSSHALLPVARSRSDTALILYTSGTTGRPKSVPLSHGNLLANLETLQALWARSAGDRLLHLLPAHHFHGLVLGLYGSLLVGNEIVLVPRFDARAALDAIRDFGVSLVMGVPTMYARMLEVAAVDDDVSGLRLAISGSAPLPAVLATRFAERFGMSLVERYGLTETGIVTSNPVDAPRPGSAGKPLPDTTVAIRVDDAHVCPEPGEESPRGEICVTGPAVCAGYGNDDGATAAAFRDGYFHTGDLGRFDADGYLWIDGRLKDLIIVGGSNVIPAEVERALVDVDGVAEMVAAGVPDDDLGEVVAAYVVPSPRTVAGGAAADTEAGGEAGIGAGGAAGSAPGRASNAALEKALRSAAESKLAAYKRPRRYFFLAELPRNAMGKIDRASLPTG